MFAGAGVILIPLAIICVLAAYFVIKTDRKLWIVIGVICLLLILLEAAVLMIMRQ
jgi:cytochrome bd-type quinol oxidase subunit 1